MKFDLTHSIVRILKPNGKTAGTGFFVSKNGLITTCAHVVADAGYTPGEEISVVLFSNSKQYQAIIEEKWWREPLKEDVAILRLLDTPSEDIFFIPLGYPSHTENIPLITFGFPKRKQEEGMSGRCEVVGCTTDNGYPVLQMRSQEVTPGFSGAPVLNPVTNRIVGMINSILDTDEYGKQAETTFITPSHVIADVCPEVEEANIERVIVNLKLEPGLNDLFVDLAGQTSVVKDKKPLISDQLEFDPVFRLMENSMEADSGVSTRFARSSIEDTGNLFDDIVGELRKNARCVLLGEAGGGKSTILARVALDIAEKRLAQKQGVIPVHLKLSAWQANQSFVDFIYSQWPFASDPFALLENGYAALYLDGLNEMGSNTDTRIKQLRGWLSIKAESKKVIITCRTDDYLLHEFDLDIPIVKIESMEESRIRLFSKKYLQRAGKNSEPFLTQIFSPNKNGKSFSLIKLASNPFMLKALIHCYANNKSPFEILPQNKGQLSKRLVTSLWNREKELNWSEWIPYNEVESMFSELAFSMIENENLIEIPIIDAKKYCSFEIMQIAQSANIIRIDNGKLKFYHQLMQEFFAAVELKRRGLSKTLKRPQIERGNRKDSRWDQVVIALCGICQKDDLLDNPDNIVNHAFKVQDPYLAAICIASGIQVNEATIEKTVKQLIGNIAIWEWLDSEKRSDVARRALSDIGEPAVPFLLSFFESESKKVVQVDRKDIEGIVEGIVKGAAILAAGGALLLLSGAIPASALAAIPLLSEGVKQIQKNSTLQKSIQETIKNLVYNGGAKNAFDQINIDIDIDINIDPIRKIRLIKILIAALGDIGDTRADSTLQKLAKNDPSQEIREAAKLAIKKIQANS
jgi:V8-like Glu-specific endopeptidase